jgi:hypothetical protein
MNSSQLNLITRNPNIQELIARLQCEESTSTEAHQINQAVASRVSGWLQEFSLPKLTSPSGPFKPQEAISAYITEYQARHGRNSCPF